MFFGGALVSCSAAPAHLPADMPATLPGQGGLLTMRVTDQGQSIRPAEGRRPGGGPRRDDATAQTGRAR